MHAARFSLPAYLERIGFEGAPAPDLATLRQMMQRQVRTVPFENLDVQARRRVSIEPEDVAAKILGTERGGYCYEVNSLFSMACTAIGIPHRILGARPIVGDTRRPRSHMIVLAFVEGGEWICDTGYGRFGLREPFDLNGGTQTQDFDTYRVVRSDDEFRIECQLGGDPDGWNGLYTFNLSPFEIADFIHNFEGWTWDWLDVPALLSRADGAYENPMIDRDPVPTWRDGRVILIGDAAHPMYPTGSNGASQAIMDGRALGAALVEHGLGDAALAAYDEKFCGPISQLVLRNRGAGPFGLLNLLDERCGGVFDDIETVIPRAERDEFMRGYRAAAGFAMEKLNASPPILARGAGRVPRA